jgi:hypothetical protein
VFLGFRWYPKQPFPLWLNVLLTIAILNFASFLVVGGLIGGDAVNGKSLNGHYYLGHHGGYHEVSRGLFTYSLWHCRSVIVTHSLALGAAFFYTLVSRRTASGQSD